jgi:hypothetical protein
MYSSNNIFMILVNMTLKVKGCGTRSSPLKDGVINKKIELKRKLILRHDFKEN